MGDGEVAGLAVILVDRGHVGVRRQGIRVGIGGFVAPIVVIGEIDDVADLIGVEDAIPPALVFAVAAADEAGDVVLVGVGGDDVFELAVLDVLVKVALDGLRRALARSGVD